MKHPVFISYARDASREHAVALHRELGESVAFLDTEDIAVGDRFPERLVDALFDAKVVVVFAEPVYFTRWYCLLEFRVARTPFLRAVERPGSTLAEREEALQSIVIAFPPRATSAEMERFPSLTGATIWPSVAEPERIAEMVLARLASNPPTLRERYEALGDAEGARRMLLEATKLPPPMRIGNIPFVPQVGLPTTIGDAFVGRADDLWRIHDVLTTERGNVATAAGLTGSIEAGGGFGKTRLALEYLYRFGPRHYQGGLFWIDAEGDPELQLYDVLKSLNPSAPEISVVRAGQGGVPGAVARAIRARPDGAPPALFILDNVPEPPSGEPPRPLETWCPVLGEVPVLTTSRTRVALGSTGNVVALPLETLDPESAVALLTTNFPATALQPDGWHEIAAWVGHLPLALEVLNRLLRFGGMAPQALLEMSRNERPSAAVDKAMEALRGSVQPGALRGVTEALSASYGALTLEEQYAARLLAWLAPEPVPEIVLEAFGPEVFPPAVRSTLRNRSFIGEVRSSNPLYFGAMHRVLADFLRSQSTYADAEIDTVSSRFETMFEAAGGRGDEGARIVRSIAPGMLSFVRNLTVDGLLLHLWSSVNAAGASLVRWGEAEFAGRLFQKLAHESARHLGMEHGHTLAAMNNLATTLRSRGDLAGAQQLLERVLEGERRILGEEHRDTLISMHNLANTIKDRGDLAGAQLLHERVLEARRRILGTEHRDTLASTSDLAEVLRHRGNLVSAQKLQKHVLEVRRRILGEQHPDSLHSLNNLAATLFDRGDLAGAQQLQERVLEGHRSTFGVQHPKTSIAAYNLALTLERQGMSSELILQDHLTWLRTRDPETLSVHQIRIRDWLEQRGRT